MADLNKLAEEIVGSDPSSSSGTENHPEGQVWHRAAAGGAVMVLLRRWRRC
jgi:hypothetical protein